MNRLLVSFFMLLTGFIGVAHASAVINPATGVTDSVGWNGPAFTGQFNPVTSVFGAAGNTAIITVGVSSIIDFSMTDSGVPGDAFALQLDGITLTPTSGNLGANTRGPGATAFFSMVFDDIFLSTGTHTFGLFVTDSCCAAGGASATFSAATAAPATVPEPGSLALIGLGMAGLVAARRKVKQA